VQASAHDFCNFNKFIGKIRKFEKSWFRKWQRHAYTLGWTKSCKILWHYKGDDKFFGHLVLFWKSQSHVHTLEQKMSKVQCVPIHRENIWRKV
jgi:hypothetical protein